MGDRFGHVKLNGKEYRIDLGSYRARDVSDFAPRATTPGGGIVYSELSLYQPINQTDWRHGFGFQWHTDSSGFHSTMGSIDTRKPGVVTRATSISPRQSALRADRGFSPTHDPGLIMGYSSDGLIAYHYGTGAFIDWPEFTAGRFVFTNGKYTFTCADSGRIYKMHIDKDTATSGTANTIVKSGGTYPVNVYQHHYVFLASGTGAGQYRKISSNTADTITVTANWDVQPANGTVFWILVFLETGVNADAKDYKFLVSHDGYIFANRYNTNYIFYDSTDDLSDLHGKIKNTDNFTDAVYGDSNGDPAAFPIGPRGRTIVGAISFAGDLYFAREDGLFRMDKDMSKARRVLDYSDQMHPRNFQTMAVFNGNLIFPIRDQLYQWNGTRVSPLTPPTLRDTVPYEQYSNFRCMNVFGNYLYLLANIRRMNERSTVWDQILYTDILCFDGVGWHRMGGRIIKLNVSEIEADPYQYSVGIQQMKLITTSYQPTTADRVVLSADSKYLIGTSAKLDGFWLDCPTVDESTTEGDAGIYFLPVRDDSEVSFDYYKNSSETSGGRTLLKSYYHLQDLLYTSWIDAGFRRVPKSLASLVIEADNLTDQNWTSAQYIHVYYRTYDSITRQIFDWRPWGGRDGVTNVIARGTRELSPRVVRELLSPIGDPERPTLEFYHIQFKFNLISVADGSTPYITQTPVLHGMTLRLIMRPETDYGYSFSIYASEEVDYANARSDIRTPKDIIDDLRETRDSKAPVKYTDPFGIERYVYVTALNEVAVEEHVEDLGAYPNIEHVINVNLVEVSLKSRGLLSSLAPSI